MSETKPLRSHVARALRVNLTCAALVLAAFGVTRALVGDAYLDYAPPATQVVDVAASEAATLVARHDCWSGEAPAEMQGVLPGHVVATVDGDTRRGGDRLVGMALEQLFDDVDHGLVVHGFCR